MAKAKKKKPLNVEIHGWYVAIEVVDISKRPNWEIRIRIKRSKETRHEIRGHRFYVEPELSQKLKIDKWSESKRREVLSLGAKKVIMGEFHEIFSVPEGGLDALRPLTESDLSELL